MLEIKKGYEYITKTFRLPLDLVERLSMIAAENNLSLNQLVIQCLEYAEKNLQEDDEVNVKQKTSV